MKEKAGMLLISKIKEKKTLILIGNSIKEKQCAYLENNSPNGNKGDYYA